MTGFARRSAVVFALAIIAFANVIFSEPGQDGGSSTNPPLVTFGAGATNVPRGEEATATRISYRHGSVLWRLRPIVGFDAATDKSFYGYAGFGVDLNLGPKFRFFPSLAGGYYAQGDGRDLGHSVEFRSGGELAYAFNNRSRIGVSYHHLSNANISSVNPGTETVMVTYSVPVGK
jgi:hypothetical protein